MRPKDISRSYEKLTSAEKAVLAFKILPSRNEREMLALTTTIPKLNYVSLDNEFVGRLDRMVLAAEVWSVEHWRFAHHAMAALYLDREGVEPPHTASHWNQLLIALDIALADLEASHGLDAGAVREMAGTKPYFEGIEADRSLLLFEEAQTYCDHILAVLRTIIEGRGFDDLPENWVR